MSTFTLANTDDIWQRYSRIIDRIFGDRNPHYKRYMRQVLGWIVCAKRQLRWREIQGAICTDVGNERVNYDKELVDSPKGLFAALILIRKDESVELVHSTARE